MRAGSSSRATTTSAPSPGELRAVAGGGDSGPLRRHGPRRGGSGHLHRYPSCVPGCSEDEDGLTRFQGLPARRRRATQEDIAGFMAAAILALSTPSGSFNRPNTGVDEGLPGHGAADVVGHDEIHATAVGRRRPTPSTPGSSATSDDLCNADPTSLPHELGDAARRPGRPPATPSGPEGSGVSHAS